MHYEITLDEQGRAAAEDSEPVAFGEEWTAEHLVLAGLAGCSLTSLALFAKKRGSVADGTARARGLVTKRDDGAYGFVELSCRLDVTIEPEPDDLGGLLEQAVWGCFVGQSLTPKPEYHWRVNGTERA
jgi:organic hydroperoxide reductase OsmC/OhrA